MSREYKGTEIVIEDGVFKTLGRAFANLLIAMTWVDVVEGDI